MVSTIVNLGAFDISGQTFQPQAQGLNNQGEVVGTLMASYLLGGAFSFVNDAETSLNPAQTMIGDYVVNDSSYASAVNDLGEVVGVTYLTNPDLSSQPTATVWRGLTPTYLPTLGGTNDEANAINASGEIVGRSGQHAVLWENGVLVDLSTNAASDVWSDAYGVNSSGMVAGYTGATSPSEPNSLTTEAAIWRNGVLTTLGTNTGQASAINAQGMVAGYDYVGYYGKAAFVWQSGTLTDLAPLVTGGAAQANSLNDAGWVVGEVSTQAVQLYVYSGQPTYHAALWENGTLVDLNSLLPANSGWVLSDATGINDRDQIVGVGTFDGVAASFLLDYNGGVAATSIAAAATSSLELGALAGAVAITDSAGNVQSSLDGLQKVAEAGYLTSVALTGSGIPTLTVSAAQLTADAAVLNDIVGNYTLTVTAGLSSAAIGGIAGHATTVAFVGDAADYSVSDGTYGLSVSGDGVSDTLLGVAALTFADLTEIVAQAPAAAGAPTTGNIAELYAAVLAREPDVAGLAFYQTYLTGKPGTPLLQFAEWFLSSPEYTAAHSYAQTSVGDRQFITDSYQNLLHRAPSAAEIAYYQTNVMAPALAGLTAGSQTYSSADFQAHAQMLVYFSASPEFLSDVQITAANPASTQHWLMLT